MFAMSSKVNNSIDAPFSVHGTDVINQGVKIGHMVEKKEEEEAAEMRRRKKQQRRRGRKRGSMIKWKTC